MLPEGGGRRAQAGIQEGAGSLGVSGAGSGLLGREGEQREALTPTSLNSMLRAQGAIHGAAQARFRQKTCVSFWKRETASIDQSRKRDEPDLRASITQVRY